MHTVSTPQAPPANLRSLALILAARSGADWRTCLRALRQGAAVIRTASVREAIERELGELGMSCAAPPGAASASQNAKGATPAKDAAPNALSRTTDDECRT